MDTNYGAAIERLQALLKQAESLPLRQPASMALATVDRQGRPTVRIVLLRGFDQRGLVFYTHSASRKGRQLAENPRAAACFYWEGLDTQVRVEGPVESTSASQSDSYWATRPRDSQLGAWASNQSEVLADRDTLRRRFEETARRFADRAVPRPPHWLGYRLAPERLEFWVDRPARLHERTVYEKRDAAWSVYQLYP